MEPRPEPERPDLALSLTEDVCHRLIHTLRTAVPPVSDTPEDHARRDNAAIAHVACLHPANADEADLAALCIAAGVQAMDCLRLARQYHGDPAFILKCTAQAAGMLRQARAMRSLLQRVQAERRKRTAALAPREAPAPPPRRRRRPSQSPPHRPPASPPRPTATRAATASAPRSSVRWVACRTSSISARCHPNSSPRSSPAPVRCCGRSTGRRDRRSCLRPDTSPVRRR